MRFKIRLSKNGFLLVITAFLAAYYIALGIYMNGLGYYNQETLFYVEKARVVFEGLGYKLKIIGLTSPLLPFYGTFMFTLTSSLLAPVFASAVGTAILFYLIASTLTRYNSEDDTIYLAIALVLFMFHPGIIYMAASGKGMYMVLIFFFMFYWNIFRYYQSNTTFHVSIASLCLVLLIFSDYKFIWITLFFIPLVFSIAVHSLNLGEKESIFRISISFNNPSLRRKLINKTFAMYVILFLLPVASIICYKMLNLTNANDLEYFHESPYATWSVLAERLNYEQLIMSTDFKSPDVSMLISAKILLICPLMLLAFYMFRDANYQILTLVTPFALVEFLHIKYEKVSINMEYYMIFVVLALLAITVKAHTIKHSLPFKIILGVCTLAMLGSGYYYMKNSPITEERNFITTLITHQPDEQQDEDKDMANYINGLPDNAKILVDDSICYPIVAFSNNVKNLVMPYQDDFMSAIEAPWNYVDYVLIANGKNPLNGYSILNPRYGPVLNAVNSNFQLIYATDNWSLYRLPGHGE